MSEMETECGINYQMDNESYDYETQQILKRIYEHSFIETPFAQRFLKLMLEARFTNEWLIIGALSRNGKSWCIRDLVRNCGSEKKYNGETKIPIIAASAPESNNATDLIYSLCRTFGTIPYRNISSLKRWLIDNIPRFGVEQIIFDDAHVLNINHFKFIKWLADTLKLERNYSLSIVLVSIIDIADDISVLKKITAHKGEDWMYQFYQRFSLFRQIQGHTIEEVADILYVYDELYKKHIPHISLISYTENIFGWLTSKSMDNYNTNRVAMGHLVKLIYEAVKIACLVHKMNTIPLDLLKFVFNTYFAEKDTLYSLENQPQYKVKGKPQGKIIG